MTDCRQYLDVLIDGLQKKNKILNAILTCNEQQAEVIKNSGKLDDFDVLVEKKAKLIDQLNQIDNGFQAVYNRVKDTLNNQKELYKPEIIRLQSLIHEMTDIGIAIETSESRNKVAIEQYFSYTQKSVNTSRKSAKAASDYYKSMSKVNYVDPQLMDHHK